MRSLPPSLRPSLDVCCAVLCCAVLLTSHAIITNDRMNDKRSNVFFEHRRPMGYIYLTTDKTTRSVAGRLKTVLAGP